MTKDGAHCVDKNFWIVLCFTYKDKDFVYCERIAKMAYVINTDECIACGACEAECPEGAISEVNGAYMIDPAKCSECGTCADVCPSGSPQKA